MKKSFMTRALATGLSLAMAFSLSAATNVTVASAASTPTMASKQFAVRVGGATKTYKASAATLKKFRITKATVGNSSKATVAVASSKKGIKVTPGTVTGSTVVKVTFKNTKTKKSTAKKIRCVVKGEEKKELTMTAEATGVKKITVKFNQAVDTATALTLTKGTAKPAVAKTTWNTDATEAMIETSAKLTTGTYTVTTTIAEKTLTADAVVAKDETLTSFELVGTTIKAYDAKNTSCASIQYRALNQYGEPMSCSTANVTIAPGTPDSSKDRKPTVSKNGEAGVTNIPDIYRIPGSKFTIAIVDTATGVTFNGEAVYGAAASAKTAESAGLYNINKGKIQDMTAGDNPEDYKALLTVKDQYGDPYTVKKGDIDGSSTANLSAVAATGLTNVKVDDTALKALKDDPIVTVDNVEYFAIPLTCASKTTSEGKAVAGDFSITVVNNTLGIVGTPTYTVANNVIISNIEISADNGIYAGQDNEMTYSVTDTQGNAVTSAAVLAKIDIKAGSNGGTLKFKKQTNGTAKLIYTTAALADGLKTGIETFTVMANEPTSTNYLVKTFTFTRQAQRYASVIKGVSSKVYTSTGISGDALTIDFKNLLIEDQYGTLFTSDELDAGKLVKPADILVTGAAINNVQFNANAAAPAVWTVTGGGIAPSADGVSFGATKKVIAYAPATSAAVNATVTIYIKGKNATETTKNRNAGYDLKLTKYSSGEVENITGLDVVVNAGNPVYVTGTAITAANRTISSTEVAAKGGPIPVFVTGKVKGNPVILTSGEYDVTISAPALGEVRTSSDVKEGTGSVTITVNTADGPQKVTREFKTSNADWNAAAKIKKGDAVGARSVSKGAVDFTASYAVSPAGLSVNEGCKVYNQYGVVIDKANTNIDYKVTGIDVKQANDTAVASYTKDEDIKKYVYHNGMPSAYLYLPGDFTSGYKAIFSITATLGNEEVTFDVTLTCK